MLSVAATLLAVAFGWAALAKLLRWPAWKVALAGYRLPEPAERAARWGVPPVELVVAGLLLAGRGATKTGAALSVALLAAFSIAVLRARALQGGRLPCGCFGGGGKRDYRLMLVRNAALGVLAAMVLQASRLAPLRAETPSAAELLPAVLAAAGLGLVVWLAVTFGRGVRR